MADSALNENAGQGQTARTDVHAAPFFLRTKLLPPRPAQGILSRARLIAKLQANVERPVTLVTANAGYGKTTLVADFLRGQSRPFVWYQLERSDADPSVFLGYLANGLKLSVPNFGGATSTFLQQAAAQLAQHPERGVDVLLNEILETVEQPLIVVLDDYHHLGTETPVHAVVDRLLAYLPEVIHVIIISRDLPPLQLARLRSQTSLELIEREDLLFTDEETIELFREVFGLLLTPDQLREYRERTRGWITALQLVRQVAQRQASSSRPTDPKTPDPLAVLRQSERDIFDYFAEEVFAGEDREVRQLLMRVALLDRIEVETCGELYEAANCATLLRALVRRNVFLTVASDLRGEEYRLHPLFQSFLRRRLRAEIGTTGVAGEHARAAEYFLEREVWEQGVRHLLEAEDFNRAAQVIAEHGEDFISTAQLTSLAALASALPAGVIEAHPRALFHRAEVARLRGEFDTAETLLRRAISLLCQTGDRAGEAEALHSLATIARRRGDYESAFASLDRAVELTKEKSGVRARCGNTRGLCLVSLGQWTEAEREFRLALQTAEELNDERQIRLIIHNLGLPAMVRGDFGEAMRWLRRMLAEERHQSPIPQEALAHLNIARCHLYRGELDDCAHHLDRAQERCQFFNLVGPLGETFETYGNLYREKNELARATEFYERAARSYDEAGLSLGRVELLEEQSLLSLKVGDTSGALSQIKRLIEMRPREKDEMGYFTATLTCGRVLIAQQEHQSAAKLLESALLYFREHGFYYYEAQAQMALAETASAAERTAEMLEHLRRALDVAARYDYDYWLRQEMSAKPQLFASEDAADLLPAELRAELSVVTERARQPVSAPDVTVLAAKPLVDLTLNLLGPVEIVRDPARPLAADAWTTRRARDIFCFIASRRHRRASKDSIVDTFWSDAEQEVVEKNFHPTVSHIRKGLNSNQPLKQNFLVYREGDYQLNPDFNYRIDTEEFERLVTDGEAARRARDFDKCIDCYERATALYRGEFMQGSYEPWVEEQRSYYREQYLRMLQSLAGVAQKKEEWARSMDLGQRILREDPFREDIHCLLMRSQAALGNRGAVKEQYETLRQLLQKELGVEPATQTTKIYHDLIG